MPIAQHPGGERPHQPYVSLREHPRYEEIKRLIEAFSPDRMDTLKIYLSKWLQEENASEFHSQYTH